MSNILFIGGAGFIGSSIINHLSQYNMRIFILDPHASEKNNKFGRNIQLLKGSLSEIDLIKDIIISNNISKIIHLASCMIPSSDFNAYISEYENIILPTIRLIKLCSDYKIQFIYFSSGGTVYGENPSLTLIEEISVKAPISYYGLSKDMIESFILFENRANRLKYLILRPSNPYGPGQNIHGQQGLIAVTIGKLLENQEITIWGDGSSIRDYIYIDDLAIIVTQLIVTDVSNLTINIGSGKGYTVNQILSIIREIIPIKMDVKYLPDRKNDVSNVLLDTSLLNNLVRIKFTSLEEGILRFYNYELENHE